MRPTAGELRLILERIWQDCRNWPCDPLHIGWWVWSKDDQPMRLKGRWVSLPRCGKQINARRAK